MSLEGFYVLVWCVFSREQLYNAVWGENYEVGINTVDNMIWNLIYVLLYSAKVAYIIIHILRLVLLFYKNYNEVIGG